MAGNRLGQGRSRSRAGVDGHRLPCRKDLTILRPIRIRRLILIVPVFLLLVTSCRASGSDASPRDCSGLDESLELALDGDFTGLDQLGECGGEGAWYVIADAAADSGLDEIARYARIRSVEADVHPYSTRSLSMLLSEDPTALRRPLAKLKKAVKTYGETDGLRAARIAVLHAQARFRDLEDEYRRYTGEPWEAPVIAAMLRGYPDRPDVRAAAERFILHSPDPAAPAMMSEDRVLSLGGGWYALAAARWSYAEEMWDEALSGYRTWLDMILAEGTACDLEDTPPVFAEMAGAAEKAEVEEDWAGYLLDAAESFGGARRFGAAFEAGKLFRGLKDYDTAAAAFSLAADSVKTGLPKDRALWYLLRVSYEKPVPGTEDEMELWSMVRDGWEDPRRFDDRLEEFVHRRVRAGEWALLERVWAEDAGEWPGVSRALAALVLAFADNEGRLEGGAGAGYYLEQALEADPVSWPGFRAAGLLDRSLPVAEEPFVRGGGSFADLLVNRYLDMGLDSMAYRKVMENPADFGTGTLRALSRALAGDSPRLSIRIAGLMWYHDGYLPDRADLMLRHPLPFGDMAAVYADTEGIPSEIFHGLIRTESAWDAWAVSRSGATGLSQFMPATWAEWVRRMRYPEDADPTDPEANAALGAAYLDWLYEREWTWSWIDTLASYNAGGGRVRTWRRQRPGLGDDLFGESLPVEEPRSYVRKVLSAATVYGYLYAGLSPAELHESWDLEMIEVE